MTPTTPLTPLTLAPGHLIARLASVDNALPAQVAKQFIDEYRGATKKAYEADLRQFFGYFSLINVSIFDAQRPHIIAFIDALRSEGAKPATIKRKVSVIRNFYAYAVEMKYTDENPVPAKHKRLHLASVSRRSQTLGPDREESIALIEAARRRNPRDYAIMRVLLHQGLRVSELCNLDVSDMRRERGHRVLHLSRKGDVEQDMAVAPDAMWAIDAYLAGRSEGPLFINADGSRMTRYQVRYVVEQCAAAANISKRLSPHSMRHACATLLFDAERPLRDIQVFMGHANPMTTIRYDLGRNLLDRSPAYALSL
jgi:site-specific recombinase XerD